MLPGNNYSSSTSGIFVCAAFIFYLRYYRWPSFITAVFNTAVGLGTHALTDKLARQEEEINSLKTNINQLSAYLQSKDSSFKYAALNTNTVSPAIKKPPESIINFPVANIKPATGKMQPYDLMKYASTVTAEKMKKIIDEKPEYLMGTWKFLREEFEKQAKKQNVSLDSNPELKRLLYGKEFFIATVKQAYNIN